tara:strand:- start:51 stop:407 length:357 start_codon:yes stop_codon:yes gene_type:complete
MTPEMQPEDFIIQVKPFIDPKTNQWTGVVSLNIISSDHSPLNNDDMDSLWHICKMMCSTLPLIEEDKEFASMLDMIAREHSDDMYLNSNENNKNPLTSVEKDGNVIKLNFKSNTKGNA